ncbi:pyridoxal-phosphate dependent enzyme [Actinokineospora sp.]|uniref:pyridoxal-phosphate dependent enzyme n=1 Tax=Actinokineospora sp. TaxID=1872133 RepID=UPI003D6A5C74
MTASDSIDLDLSLGDGPPPPLDESVALTRYPVLREFRARLGGTPLIEVPGPASGARVLAKYEMANPLGSVKDRVAFALLCQAVADHDESTGPLRLVDFSGGNMARALGRLGKLTGIPIRFAVPSTIPDSWRAALLADGVRLDLVDAELFILGIIQRATEIGALEPEWTVLGQHRNLVNLGVHEHMTGAEIVEQLGTTTPSCWVAAVGTGGTLAGVARALRLRVPNLRIVGVTPAEMPYGTSAAPNGERKIAGSGGLGYGLRQPFVRTHVPGAEHRGVRLGDALAAMAEFRELTGTRIGTSAAANWIVARQIAANLSPAETVVTLFPDAGTAEDWARVDSVDAD